MAQVVAAMMQNKAPTASVEGTKNQEEVANVPHAPRMKPYDLDKTFEGSALPTVNRHESMISHRYPVGFLTKTFLRPIECNVLPSKFHVQPVTSHGVLGAFMTFKPCIGII